MAADKAFNEPKKFDAMLLAMSHPDAMDILRTKNEIKDTLQHLRILRWN